MTQQKKPFFWVRTGISPETLLDGIAAAEQANCLSILILCSSENPLDTDAFNPILKRCKTPLFGGVFPQILFDGNKYSDTILIVGLPVELAGASISNISERPNDRTHYLDDKTIENMRQYRNFLLFVDGLSNANEVFIDDIYESIGSGNNYIGGGAGFLDLKQHPNIISNDGLLFDAGLVVALPWRLSLNMTHGWEIQSGPFLATETDGCRVKTINYQPALAVYQKEVEACNADQNFETEDFFSISSHHPFGQSGIDNEIIVRDPISTEENDIICVGEILQNSMIYILKGDHDRLISSVKTSMQQHTSAYDYLLVFDCISREIFLGDRIDEELNTIQQELPSGAVSFGAFSLGEIITGKSGSINWLNKSISIAHFSLT